MYGSPLKTCSSKKEKDRVGGGAGGPLGPHFSVGWIKNILSITYRNNLPYISLSILRFSPTNPTISDHFVVSFAAERTTRFQPRNNGIVVSIFSWIGFSRRLSFITE